MAQLLSEIEWGEPILTPVADAAWEAQIKRRGDRVTGLDAYIARSPWLREATLGLSAYRASEMPVRLFNLGALVTAQENSCRYCYGASRAFMKISGYSESMIGRIEREAHVAELDDNERAFIAFCRNLARSRPRPARAERDALIRSGYSPLAVNEMAFVIATGCFYNRLGILIACPPEYGFERMANGPVGRLLGWAAPLARLLPNRGRAQQAVDTTGLTDGPFGSVVATLAGLPAAAVMKSALDLAFESSVLSGYAKALMFAIVGRTLGCRYSETEARRLMADEGVDEGDVDSDLATLQSARLVASESSLLTWVRDTVYYQTPIIQSKTRALAARIGEPMMLDAIGVAALANATVRLAMLLE